ncbi:hypothetical protein G3T36_11900 [Diaminobutyricibacter tongyongensis]|uniref:Uncharacterized protein n=1 Tax=Leifsonia tongyongensis TaxID=1268043 RepID=A0A6L9XYS7_9MICO|nr:DUF5995 family protein [Diaminobutyricibacter tongyongensis]NEN06570.1 hypothetical protein [Diaminobutyricibacter tongyongensis]
MSPTPAPAAIEAVLSEMDAVLMPLPASDGIAVFLDIYRQVTALVAQRLTDGTFQDPAFTEALDVVFADIFLDVPRAIAAGQPVATAWQPLVDARAAPRFPLQFALAGMNAHINHDLALAVVDTCRQRNRDPQSGSIHGDFDRINGLLAQLVGPIRAEFLDKTVVQYGAPLAPLANILTSFSMDRARDAAWAAAVTLWTVRDVPFVPEATEQALANTVNLVSRQLLTPFPIPPV